MKITIELDSRTATYETTDDTGTEQLVWGLYYSAIATCHHPHNVASWMESIGTELMKSFDHED